VIYKNPDCLFVSKNIQNIINLMVEEITKMLIKNGAALVGFANLKDLPEEVRFGFPTGISIALKLDPAIVSTLKNGPTQAYIEEYDCVNQLLDSLSGVCVDFLTTSGYKTCALSATKGKVKNSQLFTPLPHKTVATKAGLGWIGKCALLITKEFGSAIRLTTVLTNAELPTANPISESACGECVKCVTFCPANAPTGKNWQAGMEREDLFDAAACYRQTKKWMRERNLDRHICGICIAVCPWTEKYIKKEWKSE
jgi:epoxyqueuosine reductase